MKNIHKDYDAIKLYADHCSTEHNCNYNVIISNPDTNGEFGAHSTYECVTDSYFENKTESERNCKIIYSTGTPTEENDFDNMFGDNVYMGEALKIENPYFGLDSHLTNKNKKMIPQTHPIIKDKVPSRNDKCVCGSGNKYKKCCINK